MKWLAKMFDQFVEHVLCEHEDRRRRESQAFVQAGRADGGAEDIAEHLSQNPEGHRRRHRRPACRRRRADGEEAALLVPAVASGFICGDGMWTFPSSLLSLAKLPVCMKFTPGTD